MKVRAISDAEAVLYHALAREHGTVFHSAEWVALFGARLVRYGVFDKSDELIGGFHLYRSLVPGLRIVRDPPFTPECGPFFRMNGRRPVTALNLQRDVLQAMAEFLDKGSHAVVSVSLNPGIQDTLPFLWRNFKAVPRYTYILNLSASLEELAVNMSSTRRNDISKAIRDGIVVRDTKDPNIVRELVLETFTRRKLSANTERLDAILSRFAKAGNSYTCTAFAEDTPIATAFVVHDSKTAYYLLGGYNAELRHHGAGALALYKAIEQAKSLGLQTFDFEGSMIPAIERYFRGFGGRLTPCFTINKAWMPLEMALKLVRRTRF